jgi:hypothetical protein
MKMYSHKGEWCNRLNGFCQEGYCENCGIYRKRHEIEEDFWEY